MLTTDGQSASLSWNKAPVWGLRPDFYYCQTVAGLLMWSALSDERTGLSFTIAPGPRQRSHFWILVPWALWPYFTVSNSKFPFSSPPAIRRVTAEVFDQRETVLIPNTSASLPTTYKMKRLSQKDNFYHSLINRAGPWRPTVSKGKGRTYSQGKLEKVHNDNNRHIKIPTNHILLYTCEKWGSSVECDTVQSGIGGTYGLHLQSRKVSDPSALKMEAVRSSETSANIKLHGVKFQKRFEAKQALQLTQ
jgi:hypothetical protein